MRANCIARQVIGRALGTAIPASFFLTTALSSGAEPPTIVLVANHADAAIIPVLRAELATLGLNVLVVDRGDHELTPGELTEAARRNRAIAAFRVLVAEGKVEVWLSDRVTGKVLLREILRTKSDQSETDDSTVVARAVELLRASLLELDVDERPTGEVAPPPKLHPKLRQPIIERHQSPPKLGLTTNFIVLGASTKAALSPGLGVALRWQPLPHWAAVARFALPVSGPTYTAAEGHAQITPRWASASLRWTSDGVEPGFRLSLEGGLGLLFISTEGIAASGYLERSTSDIDPVPYLGIETNYVASRNIAFSLGLLGGPGLQPSRIVFEPKTIGHYGRWAGLASLGLDVAWN